MARWPMIPEHLEHLVRLDLGAARYSRRATRWPWEPLAEEGGDEAARRG